MKNFCIERTLDRNPASKTYRRSPSLDTSSAAPVSAASAVIARSASESFTPAAAATSPTVTARPSDSIAFSTGSRIDLATDSDSTTDRGGREKTPPEASAANGFDAAARGATATRPARRGEEEGSGRVARTPRARRTTTARFALAPAIAARDLDPSDPAAASARGTARATVALLVAAATAVVAAGDASVVVDDDAIIVRVRSWGRGLHCGDAPTRVPSSQPSLSRQVATAMAKRPSHYQSKRFSPISRFQYLIASPFN